MKQFYFSLTFLIVVLFSSCNTEHPTIEISSEDYHHAVEKLTQIMVHDIFSPPVASRIYTYPNIAAYETLNQESSNYQSLSDQLNNLTIISPTNSNDDVNLKLASLIAYLDVAKDLVFSKEAITTYRDSLYQQWNTLNPEELEAAQTYGTTISQQVITWMQKDQYAETRTMPNYNIYSDDPSRWQPTPPSYTTGIEPHWSKIRPFVLDSAAQFKPQRHPEFSLEKDSPFYKEVMEVYTVNREMSQKGDESPEVLIAKFWDCNPFVSVNKGHFMFAVKKITPGAHWVGICKIACRQTKTDFEKTVYAYTKISLGIADAFISCWDEKYRSNLVRPETVINAYIDKSWAPVLQTPPFPEYTSGHSVVSGASSEILTSIFGEDFYFEDLTEVQYGLPIRPFNSFRAAAQEAALSRLYGGIHYRSAIDIGLDQGIKVGTLVNTKVKFLK
ncbi:MAG: vanadium-dependent haloperoxidase [Winogradskyella arenosi]